MRAREWQREWQRCRQRCGWPGAAAPAASLSAGPAIAHLPWEPPGARSALEGRTSRRQQGLQRSRDVETPVGAPVVKNNAKLVLAQLFVERLFLCFESAVLKLPTWQLSPQ